MKRKSYKISNDFCEVINFARWLWDLICDIIGCNCKK